jgi:hypothetical protein
MINNDTFIQMAQTHNSSPNRQKNIDMFNKNETNACPELLKECAKEGDKALEIKQIEYEQRLIVERMIRLELQKEQVQKLLNVLHSLDSDDDEEDDDNQNT